MQSSLRLWEEEASLDFCCLLLLSLPLTFAFPFSSQNIIPSPLGPLLPVVSLQFVLKVVSHIFLPYACGRFAHFTDTLNTEGIIISKHDGQFPSQLDHLYRSTFLPSICCLS